MSNNKKKEPKPDKERKPLAIVEVQQALNDWYDLQRNEITGVVEARKIGEDVFREIKEDNLIIQLLNCGHRISQGILSALLNSEFVPTYNPFKDYFKSLPGWNGNDVDYIEALANRVTAVDQSQFNLQFKKMLVRTISCALDDHSFNKHAFILVGREQNTGKSTFCRYLCPKPLEKYFSENITLDKDGYITLAQSLFINLDELSTLSKFELNHLKSLFSKDRISIRHPFGRRVQTDPRRASFIGSTNEDTFLSDTTGSVRWLCFEISKINWPYDHIGIDQVWSQAYSLYKSGFKFQLTVDELRENELRNQQFQQFPMEYDYVQKYLEPGNEFDGDLFMTPTEIRDHIISKSENRADIKSLEKLGKVLIQLGYTRHSKRIPGRLYSVYGYHVKV